MSVHNIHYAPFVKQMSILTALIFLAVVSGRQLKGIKMYKKYKELKNLTIDITDIISILVAKNEIENWIWDKLFKNLGEINKERKTYKIIKMKIEIGEKTYEANFSRKKLPEEVYKI